MRSLTLGFVFALAACSSPAGGPLPIRYAIFVDDWHGDFLNVPMTLPGFGFPNPELGVGQLSPAIYAFRSDCCDDTVRLFRLSDGREIPGAMRTGSTNVNGQVVTSNPTTVGFVAAETLEDGWYLGAVDARPYRQFARLELQYWSQAIDDVAYARFRIGDGVDWVSTSIDSPTVIALVLSSRLPSAALESSRVEVRRAGLLLDCSRMSTGEDPELGVVVQCAGLADGDRIEVRLESDRIGHPTGEMSPQEIVVQPSQSFEVAPDLGLNVLRTAYGIEGGGT